MASRAKPVVIDEGPQAAHRFERTMDRLLSVPKEELAKRETAYQESRKTRKSLPSKPTR